MQKIKIGEIELEFEESLDVSIEDGGKRLVVRGKQQFVPVYPTYPSVPTITPYPLPNTTPWFPPQPFPTIFCSVSGSGGNIMAVQ